MWVARLDNVGVMFPLMIVRFYLIEIDYQDDDESQLCEDEDE